MPSGRTHDSITLWSLPLVVGLTLERTRSGLVTLVVAGGFLFSGLMFGPDLDIYSCQYKRWGLLRWIWLPYRHSIRHRSLWSHAPIVGTVIRIIYLLGWLGTLGIVAILAATIAGQALGLVEDWQRLAQQWFGGSRDLWERSIRQHPAEWLGLVVGLELGAVVHSICDWTSSAYKRWMKPLGKRSPKSARSPLPPNLRAPTRLQQQPRSPQPARSSQSAPAAQPLRSPRPPNLRAPTLRAPTLRAPTVLPAVLPAVSPVRRSRRKLVSKIP